MSETCSVKLLRELEAYLKWESNIDGIPVGWVLSKDMLDELTGDLGQADIPNFNHCMRSGIIEVDPNAEPGTAYARFI